MTRLFQPSAAPAHLPPPVALASPQALDDDIALGWECANPALQFEAWEPLSDAPNVQPAGPY